MRYKYFICDVFTHQRFEGNQLAVFPDAQGLSELQMQAIAKEFNFSETTFVFPPEYGQTRKVRIFTPTTEVPFAGHPNIGTAFALANEGLFGDIKETVEVIFEEKAGLVPVTITLDSSNQIWCELSAPEPLTIGDSMPAGMVAKTLSLNEVDIVTNTHSPEVASVGLPFLFVEIASLSALQTAQINTSELDKLIKKKVPSYIHLYCRKVEGFDIRARMFAPLDGVFEDPATGSANCALIALLTHYDSGSDSDCKWKISQGTEIGRPSVLYGRTQKRNGEITGVWIGGNSVLVSKGILHV